VSAESDSRGQKGQQVLGHRCRAHALRFTAIARDGRQIRYDRRELLERRSLFPQIMKVPGCERKVNDAAITQIAPQNNQPVRLCWPTTTPLATSLSASVLQ
jgi:hypothetical protein